MITSTHEGVATVVIDHPPINLMTVEVFLELADVVERLAGDDDVRVVVLRSANPEWFIAHFDVAALLNLPTDSGPPATELNVFHTMCERLRTMPKATIAVIEGRVGGGGSELALSCDMRFAGSGGGVQPAGGRPRHHPWWQRHDTPATPDRAQPRPRGDPRLRRDRRRDGRAVGMGQPRAADATRWRRSSTVSPTASPGSRPHAVAAAKASVLRAEAGVTEQLLAEGDAFAATLGEPSARAAMERFLERGGQTPEGERRLGALAGELA